MVPYTLRLHSTENLSRVLCGHGVFKVVWWEPGWIGWAAASEVRVLEHNFVTQGPRLEHQTKLRLARELALQPQQVAIWFQNRRVRWKGKQLEKDFLLLKAEYLDFKDKYNALLDEKEKLATEELRRIWLWAEAPSTCGHVCTTW